jgi:spore coat polysaccharide biosynthesis protein SpsF
MQISAIIQCRYGSTRFPGKALAPLGDDTVLGHVIERAKKIKGIQNVIVATGDPSLNFLIMKEADDHHVDVYTYDDEDNVLARLLLCAIHYRADYVLRICGDSPFLDVGWAEELIKEQENEEDYISHYFRGDSVPTVQRYGWGCQSELVKTSALFNAHYSHLSAQYREHPTMYIYTHPAKYKIKKVPMQHVPTTCSIDTEDDLRRAKKLLR